MDAVVLAGGYATRLWPITRHRPKMFLPVGEQTVIDDVFADLEADSRIEDVYVSTNERFVDDFREYLADASFTKPELSVEETTDEDEKFGVIGALAQLVERENVKDDLLVIAGDNLISFDVADFVDFFDEEGQPALAAYDVESRESAKSYGLVELDDEEVVDFQEKPADPRSTLVSIACYAFPAENLTNLREYLDAGKNPDEPGWFIQWLQNRETVRAYTFDGAWFDIGTAESYLDAVSWHLDGESIVSPDADVRNSEIGENVHVMEGVTVEDSTLSNTVVFPDSEIAGATISNSIVDSDATISNVDLDDSLVGQHTSIQ
ncbi:MAG: sugar phosphate nucleotidyltransferase [Halopenitus sp.]